MARTIMWPGNFDVSEAMLWSSARVAAVQLERVGADRGGTSADLRAGVEHAV